MKKRFLSLITVFAMCFSLLPASVWADTTEITAEKTQSGENTANVNTGDEDAVVQSGEAGGVAVQAGEHTDHALCTHTGTCSCPDNAKNNAAFTDAKPLTWGVNTDDNNLNYLYIGENKHENEAVPSYGSWFWGFTLPAGNYYLAEDLKLSYAIRIEKNATVNLCLNGHSITKITDDSSGFEGVITIDEGGTLSLCDCKNSGKIAHESNKIGRGVQVGGSKSANFNMYGGEISGNNAGSSSDQGQDGAGVYMAGGAFNMYGGKITDNRVESNQKQNNGVGGVYAESGTFTMYGGEISGNTSPKHGGGVYMTVGKFIMSGGTISGNTATYNGGGVCVRNGSFDLKGGTISNNTAAGATDGTGGTGGGVYYYNSNSSSRSMTVSDSAKIEKNKAVTGGGVYVINDNEGSTYTATFTMNGGTISENIATANGGGVYVGTKGKFTMNGGSVTKNKAKNGGGVWTATAFTVSGAPQISDNTDSTGNTKNNVYLGTASITIGTDGLDCSARIGVTSGNEDTIESGKYVTVATGANNGYREGNISGDKGGDYVIKAEDDEVRLYNGLPHRHPVCGTTGCEESGHNNEEFKKLTTSNLGTKTLNTDGINYYYCDLPAGNWYLSGDFKPDATLRITGKVNLCLNGYSIIPTDGDCVIRIDSNDDAALTLCDCSGARSGKITTNLNGRGVSVTKGSFTMYGGNITGNGSETSGYNGAGVFVDEKTTFTMYDGTISGNKANANFGGGVNNWGTFNMHGGKITGNSAKYGGGVYNSGTFTMSGGSIGGEDKADANTATDSGGGVYMNTGTFTINNGTISGNTVTNSGGGIFVSTGKFTMENGTISDNTAANGGGVVVDIGSAFYMNNGTISDNIAKSSGGGVGVHGGAFYMKSGSISRNTANSYGGGVDVGDGLFEMSGGSITGNSVTDSNSAFGRGGGVDVYEGTFAMTGGSITGNSAANNGGGVEVVGNNTGSMIVSGNVQIKDNWQNGTLNSASGMYEKGSNGKDNNLYLGKDKTVTIGTGGLNADARIGVITSEEPTSGNPIKIATGATKEESYYTDIFIPDAENSDYTITKKSDNALYLNAHEHSWSYTANDDTDTITAKCSKCNMGGGSVTLKAPAGTLIYDGKGKAATLDNQLKTGVTAPTISYTQTEPTMQALENGAVPTNAGTYTASITIGGATVEVTYAIQKGSLTANDFVFTPPQNLTYDDTHKNATVSSDKIGVGEVTVKYYDKDGNEVEPVNAGEYTVKITVGEGVNYGAASELTADLWKFTITRASHDNKTASGSAMYGNRGTVDLSNLIEVGGKATLGTVTDSDSVLKGDQTINNKALSFEFADDASKVGKTATVVVKVTDATNYNDYNITVTLTVKNKLTPVLSGDVTLNPGEITYGQKLSIIDITGTMKNSITDVAVAGSFAWQNPDEIPGAGNYSAEWRFTPNGNDAYTYAPTTGNVTVKVNKADIPTDSITPPTAKSGLVYSGNENGYELITPGATTIGTMQYKLGENGAWSTDIPKATNAGSYEVYYRVEGTANYNDTQEQKITCNIAKRPVTISNKSGADGYKTEYMYGDLIQTPDRSNFDITGSEGTPTFSHEWIGEEPKKFSELGEYRLKVTVGETANTAGGCLDNIKVTIARNTRSDGCDGGFGYMVYNNAATVSYDIDYLHEINPDGKAIDRESLEVNKLIVKVKGNNEQLIDYDENTCDFKIAVTEGTTKGTLHVELKDLNRAITGVSFCTIVVQAENKHYKNITIEVRPQVKEKAQQTLGVTMSDFTYGDTASKPVYTAPEGTLKTSVTYATKDGTKLSEAPTQVGDYTVTVVCETKDTAYSGSTDYTITPRSISDLTFSLSNADFTYNGGEQKPTVTAEMNGKALTENKDYTVTYPTDTTNVGTKEVKIEGIGNFSGENTASYRINKATITVKPKNISKIYGDEPKFELESESHLITETELERIANSAIFTSDGTAKAAKVITGGYEITTKLGESETDNLVLTALGTGVLTVVPKKLKIKVNDVSRIYGEPNPELSASYDGFIDGEDESVLSGELVFKYDDKINDTAEVKLHENVTTASGLTSENYDIEYIPGNVTIVKIPVKPSAGAARASYLNIVFDKSVKGLLTENFIVTDSEGNTVTVTNVISSSDGQNYTLNGGFDVGKE